LEAAFILLEFPSPSRRIFIGSHSLPLSGSPYRSFTENIDLSDLERREDVVVAAEEVVNKFVRTD
jgi:hypothetical protein